MLDENIENSDTEKTTKKTESTEATAKEPVVALEDTDVKNKSDKVEIEEKDSVEEKKSKKDAIEPEVDHKDVKAGEEEPKIAKESKIKEEKEYSNFDLTQLVDEFKKLLKIESITAIKNDVEKVKQNFNKKFRALLIEKKEEFIKEGGNEIDFQYTSPLKSAFNDLVFEFKTRREKFYKLLEQEQKENLTKRHTTIEELKHLIDNAEATTMYNQFQELQKKWRAIGKIPHTKYNDTWRTYHHHVERFYDILHLNKDFRDLDFKHNLEKKLKLADKVEELAKSNDLNHAFKELQTLHRMWKEEIGPVAREFREEIWERFSNATKIIHDRRHEFQREQEVKYEANIAKKRTVIEKITTIVSTNITSHNEWQQKIKELNSFRDEFFKIGRVPRKVSDQIWNEFKVATRIFNKNKNLFYKNIKKGQHDNLEKKKALVDKAESLKDSEDFDTVTEIMKQIQAEWRTIGHVPRKFSDKLWKQFKDACNHYFDRLHGNQDEENKEQVEVFNKKKELLEGLKSLDNSEESLTLDLVNSYIDDWNKLGKLQGNMRHLDSKFNKVINALYLKLNLGEKEIAILKFKNTIANFIDTKAYRKLDNEQLFIRKKINDLSKEIQQLENNISFISNASDDNPLLKNVRDNIQDYNKQLDIWKEKLNFITNLDY